MSNTFSTVESSLRQEGEVELRVVEDFGDVWVGEERCERVLPVRNGIDIDDEGVFRGSDGHEAQAVTSWVETGRLTVDAHDGCRAQCGERRSELSRIRDQGNLRIFERHRG